MQGFRWSKKEQLSAVGEDHDRNARSIPESVRHILERIETGELEVVGKKTRVEDRVSNKAIVDLFRRMAEASPLPPAGSSSPGWSR